MIQSILDLVSPLRSVGSTNVAVLLVGAAGIMATGPAHGQHPTSVTSILNGESTPDTTLETNHNGSLLLPGTFGPMAPNDSIPAVGAGTRLMWYPAKAAFRVGQVSSSQWNASNIGKHSVAFGENTKASSRDATAMGDGTTASGFAATAMGQGTTASGDNATAMGDGTTASDDDATAMGFGTTADAFAATAMGESVTATGRGATAMGDFTTASGGDATAMGYRTTAATARSLSVGECNNANSGSSGDGTLFVAGNGNAGTTSCDSRSDALVLDQSGNLKVTGSFILPDGTALDEGSDVAGLPTNSNGASLIGNDDGFVAPGTFGSGSIPTSGAGTRMMWYPNKAAFRAGRIDGAEWDDGNVGEYSVAFGRDTEASGFAATAMGDQTAATSSGATALGDFTEAIADDATAMGSVTTAATPQSLSIGECNSANSGSSGDGTLFAAGNGDFFQGICVRSDAMVLDKDAGLLVNGELGTGSIPATGSGTRMMWYPGKAAFRAGQIGGTQWDNSNVGEHSTAFGENVTASGRKSFAAGFDARATNVEAIALGKNVSATGTQAVAIGQGADASGSSAVALGSESSAGGVAATALGRFTQAETDASLSVGKYNNTNTSSDNTLFVVGNGSSGNRSDAMRLDESGNLSIDGVVNNDVGGGPAMHFQRSFGGPDDNPQNHVVLIENTVGDLGDALAIKAGEGTTPEGDVNYISFFKGDGDTAGRIEGDEFGGVQYESTGSDYAEELPLADGSPMPEAADLVGVRGGEASLTTGGADRVMIASTAPIMVGNAPPSTETTEDRVEVAFIGQVPARVRGRVEIGDLIVASGKDDGTARAVAPSEYRSGTHGPIAGQAWASKSSKGIGKVTIAVGLGRSGAVANQLQGQQNQIDSLKKQVQQIETLKRRVAQLESSSNRTVWAGLSGAGLWVGLLLGGLFGAALFWRRRI